jgi:outer membrane lipoprotein SlyB
MNKNIFVLSIVAASVAVTGCAPRIGGDNYSVRGAGEVSNTDRGVIVSMRKVLISASTSATDNQPGAGAAIGAVSGAVLGSQVGGGRGQAVTGLLGAAAGGVAGHMIGQKLTDQEGFEYQVRLDSGRLITISQGAEPQMSRGQRVLVITSYRDRGRIVPDTSY